MLSRASSILPTASFRIGLNVMGRARDRGGDPPQAEAVSEAAPSMASDAGATETRGPASTISTAEPVPRNRSWPEPPGYRPH